MKKLYVQDYWRIFCWGKKASNLNSHLKKERQNKLFMFIWTGLQIQSLSSSMCTNVEPLVKYVKWEEQGVPGWLSRLSVWLQLRSWSRSLWVPAPCQALSWALRAWSLLPILCLHLSLCPFPACSQSVCLSVCLSVSLALALKNNKE